MIKSYQILIVCICRNLLPVYLLIFQLYLLVLLLPCLFMVNKDYQYNVHFTAKFCCGNKFEDDKIMLFQPRQLPFSAFRALSLPSVLVSWWLWKEPVSWWWDEDADSEMDRVTADARCDHHWQPQHLVKFATALLMCSCDSSSQMVCTATFNSSVVLGFGRSTWYYSSMAPKMW